jgi:uncharacterized protein (TIGR03086 family)
MIFDPLAALDSADGEFRRHLITVDERDWAAATPCTGWDVHDLVAHVVGGNRFAWMVLDGRTAAEAMGAVMAATQLGADPLASFDESTTAMRLGFHRAGALDAVVSHPLGELSGGRFLGMRVFDVTLHAWDLATALGRDVTLEERLVELVLDTLTREGPAMGFGIEPCGRAGPDASAFERLLDLSGRGIVLGSSQPRT